MSSKIVKTAVQLLLIEDDLKFRLDYTNENPTVDDFSLYAFEQVWGSTALGFGCMGGQQMTSAMTFVFVPECCNQDCFVYFGNRFAYHVPYSDKLREDLKAHSMASVARSGKYRKE